MYCKNYLKFILLISAMLALFACRMPDNFGFNQSFMLNTVSSDGPPEYKAGWYAGCRSAMSLSGSFANGVWYKTKKGGDYGNGVYQHDPAFQTGWGQGYVSCYTANAAFVNNSFAKFAPLQ